MGIARMRMGWDGIEQDNRGWVQYPKRSREPLALLATWQHKLNWMFFFPLLVHCLWPACELPAWLQLGCLQSCMPQGVRKPWELLVWGRLFVSFWFRCWLNPCRWIATQNSWYIFEVPLPLFTFIPISIIILKFLIMLC